MKELQIKKITGFAALTLSAFVVLSGCVKRFSDKIDDATNYYAVTGLNSSDTSVTTDEGKKVDVLNVGTYFVQDDYVGCTGTSESVGTLVSDNKLVVSLSSGKRAACVKPSTVAKMKVKPEVTFFKAPQSTTHYIQTLDVVRTSGRTDAVKLTVEGDVGIKLLDVVDYSTNSPLLNKIKDRIDLRALPNETYKVLYKITPQVLYIMKVAQKEKVSHLDLPIADNLGNGEYAVPIASVAIETFEYVNQRNTDRQKTNVYRFLPTTTLSKTTHIKFDYEDIKAIELPPEIGKDLFPSDYFTRGQWYTSEAVVDTRPGSEGFIGTSTGAFDTDLRAASRVQFTRTSTALVACNVGIDQRYADDEKCLESASVFTIPATGHAFEIKKDSTDIEEVRIQSIEAPFVKVNFSDISSLRKSIDEIISLFRDTNEDQLLELQFSENKFNVITQRGANGRRVIYSFLRADNRPEYTRKRHYKDDRLNKFGYFVKEKARIKSTDVINQEEDLEKEYLVQRHNPNQPIKYYFSSLTPDYANEVDPFGLEIDYREIGRKAVEYWNAAFERAGASTRIVLSDDSVQYGDIEYNTLNLIDSERGSNLLGIGPSLVDPYTGEVINANANVYIAPFREIVASQVRSYIRSKIGYLEVPIENLPEGAGDNSPILGGVVGDLASFSKGIQDTITSMVPTRVMELVADLYHYGVENIGVKQDVTYKNYIPNTQVVDLYSVKEFNSENSMVQAVVKISKQIPELITLRDRGEITFNPRSKKDLTNLRVALESVRPTLYRSFFMTELANDVELNPQYRQIGENCSEVNELIAKIKARTPEGELAKITTEEELPALRKCMTKIIPDGFTSTLVHEIGHTLGLRHNFKSTADDKNFFTTQEVKDFYGIDMAEKDLPKSASAMEYVKTSQDRLYFPGHYDIAAIRYGYANKVEVNSSAERPNTPQGKYVELVNGKNEPVSIADKMESASTKVYPYYYCTDIEASLAVDPLCATFDIGSTPQTIVEDNITAYWESFVLYNNRYDRISPGLAGPISRPRYLRNLQRIYNEWRIRLANYLGKEDTTGNVYLQRYTPESYTQLLERLKTDPNFDGKEYLAVRDQIFDFLIDVAFFPNQYCVVQTSVGVKALELTRLRDELKNQVPFGTKISNCEHEEIKELIAEKGLVYLAETGLPVDNMWYAVNPSETFQEAVDFRSVRAPLDVVGTFFDRFFAVNALGARANDFGTAIIENVFPNMLDEPDLFIAFANRLLNRLTQGVDLKEPIERTNSIKLPEEAQVVTPNFGAESALLKAMWVSLENGSRNPFINNARRSSMFTRDAVRDPRLIEEVRAEGGFILPITDGSTLVVRPDAPIAFALSQGVVKVFQTFQAANQKLPKLEGLSAQLASYKDLLKYAVKPEAEVMAFTAEQYLDYMRVALVTSGVHPLNAQVGRELYIGSWAPYILYLQEAYDAILEATEAGEEPPRDAVEYLNKTLADWNQKGLAVVFEEAEALLAQQNVDIDVVVPTKEYIESAYANSGETTLKNLYSKIVQNIAEKREYVRIHGDELEAQYDLLRSILIFDYSEINEKVSLRAIELGLSFAGSVDGYTELMNSSKPVTRAFARKYLSPKAIMNDVYFKDSLANRIKNLEID